jgi:hypothetical protein
MSPFCSLEFGRGFVMAGKLVDPCGRLQTLLPLSVISALRLRLHIQAKNSKERNPLATPAITSTNTPENRIFVKQHFGSFYGQFVDSECNLLLGVKNNICGGLIKGQYHVLLTTFLNSLYSHISSLGVISCPIPPGTRHK